MKEIIIDTTNRCKMHCKYCGTDAKRDGSSELDEAIITKILKLSSQYDENIKIFLGGGCFLEHSEWVKIIQNEWGRNVDVVVDIPLNQNYFDQLNSYNPSDYHYRVSLSLWGINGTQIALSGMESQLSINRAIECLRKFQDSVQLSFVITNELINQKNEISGLLKELKNNDGVYFHRLMPSGRNTLKNMPSENKIKKFKLEIEKCNFKPAIVFHHTIMNKDCVGGNKRIFVNHNKEIYACGWINENSDKVTNYDFDRLNSISQLFDLSIKSNCLIKGR